MSNIRLSILFAASLLFTGCTVHHYHHGSTPAGGKKMAGHHAQGGHHALPPGHPPVDAAKGHHGAKAHPCKGAAKGHHGAKAHPCKGHGAAKGHGAKGPCSGDCKSRGAAKGHHGAKGPCKGHSAGKGPCGADCKSHSAAKGHHGAKGHGAKGPCGGDCKGHASKGHGAAKGYHGAAHAGAGTSALGAPAGHGDHGLHSLPPEVVAFHQSFAAAWHKDTDQTRREAACAKIGEWKKLSASVRKLKGGLVLTAASKDLHSKIQAVGGACGRKKGDVQAALVTAHDALHTLYKVTAKAPAKAVEPPVAKTAVPAAKS